jgi:hypothetical protein
MLLQVRGELNKGGVTVVSVAISVDAIDKLRRYGLAGDDFDLTVDAAVTAVSGRGNAVRGALPCWWRGLLVVLAGVRLLLVSVATIEGNRLHLTARDLLVCDQSLSPAPVFDSSAIYRTATNDNPHQNHNCERAQQTRARSVAQRGSCQAHR